jgi:anti-sigma regulatory factor (Ser/Thr protein kinase)
MSQQQPEEAEQHASALHTVEERDVRRRVPAQPEQVGAIRRAVMASADTHGITEPLRADIALALTEACANVVNHAYRDSIEPGALMVESYRRKDEFVIVVSDEGPGISPRTDSPGLGLGLALIARLTHRMEIGPNQPAGARLVMAFAIAG